MIFVKYISICVKLGSEKEIFYFNFIARVSETEDEFYKINLVAEVRLHDIVGELPMLANI